MEIDCTVPPADDYQRFKPRLADDPYVADLLQVADSRIAELERQVTELGDKNEIADRKMASFRQQVILLFVSYFFFFLRRLFRLLIFSTLLFSKIEGILFLKIEKMAMTINAGS